MSDATKHLKDADVSLRALDMKDPRYQALTDALDSLTQFSLAIGELDEPTASIGVCHGVNNVTDAYRLLCERFAELCLTAEEEHGRGRPFEERRDAAIDRELEGR